MNIAIGTRLYKYRFHEILGHKDNRAEVDILNQLGVRLSETGMETLKKTPETNQIQAETALSKAIVAQQQGTIVETMAYLYNATSFNPSLQEANSRLSLLTSEITSGNIGENVRNDIQRRNGRKKYWTRLINFFKNIFPLR
jgi:hypothetical protein